MLHTKSARPKFALHGIVHMSRHISRTANWHLTQHPARGNLSSVKAGDTGSDGKVGLTMTKQQKVLESIEAIRGMSADYRLITYVLVKKHVHAQ